MLPKHGKQWERHCAPMSWTCVTHPPAGCSFPRRCHGPALIAQQALVGAAAKRLIAGAGGSVRHPKPRKGSAAVADALTSEALEDAVAAYRTAAEKARLAVGHVLMYAASLKSHLLSASLRLPMCEACAVLRNKNALAHDHDQTGPVERWCHQRWCCSASGGAVADNGWQS